MEYNDTANRQKGAGNAGIRYSTSDGVRSVITCGNMIERRVRKRERQTDRQSERLPAAI